MNLKQLFCKHIAKDEEYELLTTTISATAGIPMMRTKKYAVITKCIKCGKLNIEIHYIKNRLTLEETRRMMDAN